MTISQAPEQGESQETLRRLADDICAAIVKLPKQMDVNTEKAIHTVSVVKHRNTSDNTVPEADAKPHFAYTADIRIRGTTISSVEIEYREPYETWREGPNGSRSATSPRILKVITVPGVLLDTDENGKIKIPPKVKAEDIELLVGFLQKAVAQHEETERAKAQAIEADQLRTAKDIRQVLSSLRVATGDSSTLPSGGTNKPSGGGFH